MNSNRQRAIALRAEAGQFREQAQRRNIKVAEEERESLRLQEEARKLENIAEKLMRDRARSLDEIGSKLRFRFILFPQQGF